MRIKKLEIFGFKSFADRVLIQFDAGVTGIVGPNGCGKSNVVDALRWVMGEQNAKHLRGDQMQDIIFNGAQKRGPMGLAEVTLTLENDGQLVPQEYKHFEEIEVTRRLYRNGDSEYEINKQPCRLRDITEFFLGTGVGTKAYSIIEQGRVSSIVQAKPEERRNLIEEAAGITKYKMRKQAAERKMESTQQNLLRINDIRKEVENRLTSLEKQAQKAEKFQNLNSQIRNLELHEAALRFFEFTNQLRHLSVQHQDQNTLFENHTLAIQEHESRFILERETLTEHEQKLSLTINMIHAVNNTIALAKQDILFTQNTLASKQKQMLHIHAENKRLQDRLTQLNTEQAALLEQKNKINSETNTVRETLSKASQHIQNLTQTRADKHRAQQDIQSKILQASREATQAQADINTLQIQHEQTKTRDENLRQELELLQNQLGSQETQKQDLQTEISQNNTQKTSLQTETQNLQNKLNTLTTELNQSASQQQQNNQKIASQKGRLSALLDSIQESKKPEHTHYQHVAEGLEIPEKFESLVEDACSQRLEAYLVKSISEGLELAKHGRIRFFTQSTEAFKFKIVKNTEEALRLWPGAMLSGTVLITESGELFDTDHSCVAGTRTKSAGLLAKKREIQKLETDLQGLEQQEKENLAQIDLLNTQKNALLTQLESTRNNLQALSIHQVRLEEALRNQEQNDKNLEARIRNLNTERQKLQTNTPLAEQNLKLLQDKWTLALDIHQKLENDFKTLQSELLIFEADFAVQSEAFTRIRIDAANAEERQNNLIRSHQQTEQNLTDIRLQSQNLDSQLKEIAQDELDLIEQARLAAEKIRTADQELLILKQTQETQKQACDQQKQALTKIESLVANKRLHINNLQKILHQLLLEIRESELAIESLNSRLFEKYKLKMHEILSDYHLKILDLDSFEYDLAALKRQIDHLGPIHQGAIQEFNELSERYHFLKTQGDDLAQALAQLESAIQKINETTKQRFEEAFTAINNRFSQVFPRLFRGGKAWLQLTDPNDLLNSGVEIFAQPPGKKLASIALMSGGEKALTATSLIFAIFLIKPSPFCLLDEVDAPLDEANVDRFSVMVQEMSKISQFIVITHNKRTMEKSDQLYGVTMEQPGISKTVHVRVKEAGLQTGPGSELAFEQ